MNCERLHELLDRYLAGALDDGARQEFEAHVAGCGECRSVVALMSEDAGPSIVQPVLSRTTGRACPRVQEEIATGDAWTETVRAHVDECPACERFASVLVRCDAVLPDLAQVMADADFASDVVMATVERPKLSHVAWRRWLDRVESWLERPRAAQELAYAVTVVLVLLTATPVSPFPEVPAWFGALTRSPLAGVDSAQVVGDADLGTRVLEEVQARGGRIARDLGNVGQGIATTGAGFLTGDPDRVHEGADAVGCGLQSLWLGVRAPEEEVDGPCADPSVRRVGGGTTTAMIVIATGGRT